MSIIAIIAAIDEQGGLGKNNQLLCHLPADLKRFKTITMGKPIIMGHKTFLSIGRPLPGRLNIVLSRQQRIIPGVTVVHSLQEALDLTTKEPEVMIIGGAELYQTAYPLAHKLYLTRIHHTFEADVFFPHIDFKGWHCEHEEFLAKDERNPFDMTFCDYSIIQDNFASTP